MRAVELKKIDLATEMQRPMAKQAEAGRGKRSKVIHAEGELQAAERLAEAARVLASEEVALQLDDDLPGPDRHPQALLRGRPTPSDDA